VFLGVGARFDFGQTAYRPENLAPYARRTFLDIDPNELSKLAASDAYLITADAGMFLEGLLTEARLIEWPDYSRWHERIQQWKTKYPLGKISDSHDYLETYEVVEILSDEMVEGDIFVPGSSGACSEVSMQAFQNKQNQRVFNSEGLGPMGFGIAAPIGAACLNPEAIIYSIDGDGGFQMNIQELEVAVRRKSKICWIVLDNDGYGSIKVTQDGYFSGRRVASDPSSGLTLPDTNSVALAYGLVSVSVKSGESLRSALRTFRSNPVPTVIVAKVNPEHRTEPRVASRRRDDGVMESDPMEDLSPLLDRQELRDNLSTANVLK
jgi:acetolactate synthase-1/2/3 large subunit